MIRVVSFLIITLFVGSCGLLDNTQFSKRKHLKGHFWNLKKKHRNASSPENKGVYLASKENTNAEHKAKKTVPKTSIEKPQSEPEELVIQEDSKDERSELTDDKPPQKVLSTTNVQPEEIVEDDKNEPLNERPSKSELNVVAFTVVLIGVLFWSGLIALIVSLLLHLSGEFIPWLFYYGLFAAGIPVLALVLILAFVMIVGAPKNNEEWK